MLTGKDLELYDYLHNKPKPVILRNHFTEMDEETLNHNKFNKKIKKRFIS